MNNAELNQKLRAIADESEQYEAFGGKAIPYFGWFWRTVDFDRPNYLFLVLEEDGIRHVGFDESGKFRPVGAVNVEGQQWDDIRALVRAVADNPCEATLRALNEAVQGLL